MFNRRQLLKGLGAVAVGASAGAPLLASRLARSDEGDPDKKPTFLIVLTGFGGASIIDSFLAIRESESANAPLINAFPDQEVQDIAGTPFRAVDLARQTIGPLPVPFEANQSDFVRKHSADMMVATLTGTSVNHNVAQARAISGNHAWLGRTLQESVALEYGDRCIIPNVNMATGGYIERGKDASLPNSVYSEMVADPTLWPLSLDGMRGIKGVPDRALVEQARALRDGQLEPASVFKRTFGASERLAHYTQMRESRFSIEEADLITRLNLFIDNPPAVPLAEYGLGSSPDAAALQAVFPDLLTDPLEAQAALSYLLFKNRVSVTATIGPTFNLVLTDTMVNPPLSFDFSHSAHRATQAVMWKRILGIADRLIDLLRAEPFDDGGESLWDRTVLYIATDFGRSRNRSANAPEFGTSHHLNNGVLLLSPLVNGNTMLGGVDPDTGLTFGFDLETGAPEPGRTMTEAEIYSGILGALGISTAGSGLPDVPAMRRS